MIETSDKGLLALRRTGLRERTALGLAAGANGSGSNGLCAGFERLVDGALGEPASSDGSNVTKRLTLLIVNSCSLLIAGKLLEAFGGGLRLRLWVCGCGEEVAGADVWLALALADEVGAVVSDLAAAICF